MRMAAREREFEEGELKLFWGSGRGMWRTDWIVGCEGTLAGGVAAVDGPGVGVGAGAGAGEGFNGDGDGGTYVETLPLCDWTGVAAGFGGGGVPATVWRRVIAGLWVAAFVNSDCPLTVAAKGSGLAGVLDGNFQGF